REVERPDLDVEGRVDLAPVLPGVVGAIQGGVLALDDGVDHVRPRRRDSDRDPALVAARQALLELLPGLTAVGALEEAAPWAAGTESPRVAAELPHPGVQDAGVLGVRCEVRAAGVRVDVKDLLPGLAAVSRLEDAALLAAAPQLAGGAHPHRLARLGIDDD